MQAGAVCFTAAVTVWGATAYNYINTGFSIALIIFGLYVIGSLVKKDWPQTVRPDRFMLAGMAVLYSALLFVTLFHLGNMKNLSGGYFSAVGFILYTLPLWMLLYVGWDHDIRKVITWTLYAILYALCLYGLYHYFKTGETRLSSFYFFPTRIGMMLDMFLPFTVGLGFYYRKEKLILLASAILVPLEVVCIFFAQVRGSYMAIMISALLCCIVYLAQNYKKLGKKTVAALIASLLALLVVMGSFLMVTDEARGVRMKGIFSDQIEILGGGERLLMWDASYKMWKDHPVTGIGLDEWQKTYASEPYRPPTAKEIGQVMPHNVFIYFFTTGGTIAGIAYIFYVLCMLVWLIRENKNHFTPISMAMLFLFLAATFHGLVDQTFILKLTGRIYYMLLGAGILFQRWAMLDGEKLSPSPNDKAG